jgi:hypothetical protein
MIISAREPLILYDPLAAPAKALLAWERWATFREEQRREPPRWVTLGLQRSLPVDGPRFTNAFKSYESRLIAAALSARKRLDALIVRNAPAAAFEEALQSARVFTPPDPAARPPVRPPPDLPGWFRFHASGIGGHTSYMGRWVPPTYPEGFIFGPVAAYEKWLAWRRAEDSGDWERMETARKELLPRISSLPPAAIARVVAPARQRRAAPEEPVRAPIPLKGTAIDKLVVALSELSRRKDLPDVEAVRALTRTWQDQNVGGEMHTSLDDSRYVHAWSALARIPGSVVVFELRATAAKDLLARIVGGRTSAGSGPAGGGTMDGFRAAAYRASLGKGTSTSNP